ncbi:unnamed protein product [Amoebophrya sp. A120]|nr:unnamed protein product [Amoebophrya sp. A120]|eukprot:GSA120T00016282001.1
MNAREPRQKDITMSDEALAKREERIKKMRSASADDAEDGEAWLRANVLGVDLFGEGPEAEEAERKTFGDPPPPKTGQQVVPDGEQVEIGADLEMFLEAWELTQDRAVFRLKFQADDTQPDETGNARFVVRLNEASENLSLESQKISVLAKTEQEIGDKQSELDYEWLWWFYFTPQLTPHSCVQIATSPAITQNAKEVMSCLQWPPETGAEAFTVVDCVSGKSLQAFCVEKPRWDKDAFYFFRKITEEEDLEKDSSLLSVNADNGQLLSEIPAHGADGILRMYIDKQKQHNPPKPQQAVRKAKESEIQKEAWGALLSGNDGDEESPESVGGESSFDDSKVKGMLQLYSVRKKDEEEDEDGTTQASQSPVLAVTVDNGGGPEANLRVLPVIPATGSYYEWQFKTLIKFNEKFRGHEIPCGTMQLSQHSLTAGQQLCLQQDTGSGGNLVLKQCNTVGRLVCLNVVSPGEAESTRKPGRMRVELFFGDTVTLMELHNQKAQMSSPVLVKMDDLLRQEDSTPTRYDVEVVGEEGIERRKMVETLDAIVADPDHKAKLNRCLGMDAPEPSTDGGSFLEANYRLRDPHAQPQSPERRTGDVEDCISDIESAGDQGGSLMYQYAKRMARDSLGQSLDTEIRNMLDSARSPASKLAICSMAFEKSATQSDLQLRDRCLASAQGFEEIAANVASGEAPPAEMMRTKGFRQLFQNAKTLSRITQRKNTRGKPDEKAFRMRFVYKESDELRVVSAVLVHREGGGAESVILRRVDGTPEDIQTWFLIADDALSAGGDDGTENKIRASECGKILPSFRREGEAWKCLAAAGSDRLQMIDTGDGTVIGYGVKEKCPEWCFEATPSGIAVYLQSPQEHSKKFLTCRVSDPNAIRAKLGPPALVPNVEEQGRHAVLQIEGFTDLAELNPDLAEEYSKKWKKVKNSRQEDNAVFALQYGNARFGAVANEGARAKSEWMGAEQDAAEHYWIFIVANPDLSVNADTACGYLMSEHLVNADTGRQDICLAQNFQELTVCSPEGNTICLKRMTRKLGGEAHVLELKLFVSEGQDDEDAGESTPEWLRIPYGEEDNADRDAGLLVESPTTTLLEYEAAQVKVLDPGQDENREAKVTRLLNLAEHRQQQQQGEEGAARNRYQTPHAADTALRFGSAFGTNADLSPQRRRPDVDPEPDWPEPEDVDADEETIRECIFDPVGYFFENRHYYPYSDHGVTRWRETLSQQDARDVTGRREVTLRQQCGGCKIVEGPTQYAGVTTVWVHRLGRLYRADWNDEEQFEVTEKLPDVDGGGMATLVLDPTEDQQLATIFESGRSITTHCSTDSYAEHRAREV